MVEYLGQQAVCVCTHTVGIYLPLVGVLVFRVCLLLELISPEGKQRLAASYSTMLPHETIYNPYTTALRSH